MNVRSIFRPWVVSVDGDERLADAAERMHNEQVGSWWSWSVAGSRASSPNGT